MAIVVRECLGIEKRIYKGNDGKEKCWTVIHAVEPFPTGENCVGMKVWTMGTYQSVSLKVGDKFKAYFDSVSYFDKATGKTVERPVLAELVVVPDIK